MCRWRGPPGTGSHLLKLSPCRGGGWGACRSSACWSAGLRSRQAGLKQKGAHRPLPSFLLSSCTEPLPEHRVSAGGGGAWAVRKAAGAGRGEHRGSHSSRTGSSVTARKDAPAHALLQVLRQRAAPRACLPSGREDGQAWCAGSSVRCPEGASGENTRENRRQMLSWNKVTAGGRNPWRSHRPALRQHRPVTRQKSPPRHLPQRPGLGSPPHRVMSSPGTH